jgi:SAM-dependent methyltransferase
MAVERRLSFGSVAELYDRARPSYPAALVDDVLALAPSPRVLEVGAGTGKATVLFAARGAQVLALEPDPEMAAVARRNAAGYDAVEVVETEFEQWEAPEPFGALISAQAWHWIAPEVRYARARAALLDGGLLAVFWNRPDWDRCALRDEIDEVYRDIDLMHSPGPMQPRPMIPARRDDWTQEIAATARFTAPEVRLYEWARDYTTEQYIELLQTHSDHILLPPAQRAALLDGVAAVIDAHGGAFGVPYSTRLCLARAC